MGYHSFRRRLPHRLVCHAKMASKLRLQNGVELVGVCAGGNSGSGSIIINSKLAELEGGSEESGGEFEI